MKRLSLIVFALSVLLCLAHAAAYYRRLPESVYSHFGLSGAPDATMGKTALLAVYVAVVLVLGGLQYALSSWMLRVPREMLKLPNKAHWLSERHEPATRAFLASHLLWIGTATMVFILVTFHHGFRVSLGLADRLPPLAATLGGFAVFAVTWFAVLRLRFRRPAGLPASSD